MRNLPGMSWIEVESANERPAPAPEEPEVCAAWIITGDPSWPTKLTCNAGRHAVGTQHVDPSWGLWGRRTTLAPIAPRPR